MPRITLTLEPDLYDQLVTKKPKRQALSAFCADLIEQQALGLDSASRLPAYRVGAGTTGHLATETDQRLPSSQSSTEVDQSPSSLEESESVLLSCGSFLGDGVGRESERTPRKTPFVDRSINGNLLAHADLIADFWRIKGGSKNHRAWSLLMTELTKIQEQHGDALLRQQIELAINGKWKGITLANMERFTGSARSGSTPVSASGTPMTMSDQIAASALRKIKAMEAGNGALF